MKVGIVILARTNFGRWPDKILYELMGRPIFEWVILKSKLLGIPVIVSTTKNVEDQIIVDTAERMNVIVSYGNPDDRNERFAQAILENDLDYMLSISPAMPFFDVDYSEKVLTAIQTKPGYDFYFIGSHTCAVMFGFKAQKILNNLDNPNRDEELFVKPIRENKYAVYPWYDLHIRNRYLFNYNIAFPIQAHNHKQICEYLGYFPKHYEDIRKALMGIE